MSEFEFVARVDLAAVFLFASGAKALEPERFLLTVRRLVGGHGAAGALAWLVVLFEFVVGVLSATGLLPWVAIGGAVLLLAAFAGASMVGAAAHETIPCNCFGATDTPLGARTLVRTVLPVAVVCGYGVAEYRLGRTWWPAGAGETVPLLGIASIATLLATWLLAVPTLGELIRSRWVDETRLGIATPQREL